MMQAVVVLAPLWIGLAGGVLCRVHLQTVNLFRTERTILFPIRSFESPNGFVKVDSRVK